jgi:hypothetical protein
LVQGFALPLEQANLEKVSLPGKELLATPCREMPVGGLRPPLNKHFRREMF